MAGGKLSGAGSRRTPRHIWTTEQKRCLLLLSDGLRLSSEQTTLIFNKVFEQEIDMTLFPEGLPRKSVRSQYTERKQLDNASWSQILRPNNWEEESRKRDQLSARIKPFLDSADGKASPLTSAQAPDVHSSSGADARKRKRDVLVDHHEGVNTGEQNQLVVNRTKARRLEPIVLVRRSEANDRSAYLAVDEMEEEQPAPRTPTNQKKSELLSPPDTVQVVRRSGPALQVSPRIRAEMQKGYSPPSEEEAHPPLCGGIFYRRVLSSTL